MGYYSIHVIQLTLIFSIAFGLICFAIFLIIDGQDKPKVNILDYRMHHSAFGALVFLAGLVVSKWIFLALGLGIYLSHIAEEMYFNGVEFKEAIKIFFTREDK